MSAPAPIQEQPVEDGEPFPEADTPVEWDYVSEKDMDKMFRMFDAHPELVDDPEKAAIMAGVVLPDMKTSAPMPVKRETSLESLPANTESVSAVGSNTQPTMPAPSQTNIPTNTQDNVPKFINGEPSALWRSQQLLHRVNPAMYPAW